MAYSGLQLFLASSSFLPLLLRLRVLSRRESNFSLQPWGRPTQMRSSVSYRCFCGAGAASLEEKERRRLTKKRTSNPADWDLCSESLYLKDSSPCEQILILLLALCARLPAVHLPLLLLETHVDDLGAEECSCQSLLNLRHPSLEDRHLPTKKKRK